MSARGHVSRAAIAEPMTQRAGSGRQASACSEVSGGFSSCTVAIHSKHVDIAMPQCEEAAITYQHHASLACMQQEQT